MSSTVHKKYHEAVVEQLEGQLAAQASLLRECLEVVEEVATCVDYGAGSDDSFYYVALKKPVVIQAAALLPKLEAVMEKDEPDLKPAYKGLPEVPYGSTPPVPPCKRPKEKP